MGLCLLWASKWASVSCGHLCGPLVSCGPLCGHLAVHGNGVAAVELREQRARRALQVVDVGGQDAQQLALLAPCEGLEQVPAVGREEEEAAAATLRELTHHGLDAGLELRTGMGGGVGWGWG